MRRASSARSPGVAGSSRPARHTASRRARRRSGSRSRRCPSRSRRGSPTISPTCSRPRARFARASGSSIMPSVASSPSTAIAPARRCAFAVVRRVFERGAYADLALHAEAAQLDRRDRALATRLAFGTVQRKGTLDHLIERLAGRPVGRLDGPVLAALRLGLYELLYLSGAPDRAVVADAVELAKVGGGRGHGLVNAVLRRAAREGATKLLATL